MTTQWRWGPVISTLLKHFTRCLVTSLDKPIFSEPTSTWKPRVGCPTVHGGTLVLILSKCDPWDRTDSRKMLLFFYERTKRESVWTDHLGKTNTKHHRSQIKRWEISRLSCPVSQFSFWQADHGSCLFLQGTFYLKDNRQSDKFKNKQLLIFFLTNDGQISFYA